MPKWNSNPSWTPKEEINGGLSFASIDDVSADDFNKMVENMQYLYNEGGDFDLSNYPIGAVYISSNPTSPAELFGGDWTPISNVFLLAAGNYPAGSIGGSATVTLTEAQMPSHNHQTNVGQYSSQQPTLSGTYGDPGTAGYSEVWSGTVYPRTYDTGGNQPHNNMPPYKAFYMWERIA